MTTTTAQAAEREAITHQVALWKDGVRVDSLVAASFRERVETLAAQLGTDNAALIGEIYAEAARRVGEPAA